MMRAARWLLLPLLVATLIGCGFQLRGTGQTAVLPFDTVVVTAPSGPYPLRAEIVDVLRGNNVTVLEESPAGYQLVLSAERNERRAISINTRARAGQYELTLSVEAALYLDGQLIGGPATFRARDNFYEDTANITGSNSGLELTLGDLRRDLAGQIIRRIQALDL